MKYYLLLVFSFVTLCCPAQHDPTRTTAVIIAGKTSVATISAQDAIIGTQITAHILLNNEIKETNTFRKQFNDFLSNFNEVLTCAASLYGIYSEVDHAIKNVRLLTQATVRCPDNTLAVAFSERKQKVYRNVVTGGIDIVGDIVNILPLHSKEKQEKNSKMTKAERILAIAEVRKKLADLNDQMYLCYKYIKFTTLMDTWYDLKQSRPVPKTRSMKEIVESSRNNWFMKAQGANKYNTRR